MFFLKKPSLVKICKVVIISFFNLKLKISQILDTMNKTHLAHLVLKTEYDMFRSKVYQCLPMGVKI